MTASRRAAHRRGASVVGRFGAYRNRTIARVNIEGNFTERHN
jgi:hypothetical protein